MRRPTWRMNAVWDEWLSSTGTASDVVQPEFTWGRVHTDTTDRASWIYEIYEIIDVVGSNRKSYSPHGIRCTARRGDDLPHPRTSDHWPVGLRWSGVKKKRKPQDSSDHIVHRPLPSWLLDNAEFQRVADDCFVCKQRRCMLVPPHFSLLTSSLPRQHVRGWSLR